MTRPALGVSFVASKGPIEEALAKMWVEILGIEGSEPETTFSISEGILFQLCRLLLGWRRHSMSELL